MKVGGHLKIQEQAIKLICNLLSQEESSRRVMREEGLGINSLYSAMDSENKVTLKYVLGSLLNYTQVFHKASQGDRGTLLIPPFDLLSPNKGFEKLNECLN
jgi:hypothetical protein